MKKKKATTKKLTEKEKLDVATDEFHKILSDPELMKRSEELHKKLSYVSWEDMHRPFTI
jgi:hypothetical protein